MLEPCNIKGVQKQLFASILHDRCPLKFFQIYRKAPVLESLFNKFADLKELHHKCFSMIFAKLLTTPYNKTPYTIKIAYG